MLVVMRVAVEMIMMLRKVLVHNMSLGLHCLRVDLLCLLLRGLILVLHSWLLHMLVHIIVGLIFKMLLLLLLRLMLRMLHRLLLNTRWVKCSLLLHMTWLLESVWLRWESIGGAGDNWICLDYNGTASTIVWLCVS